MSSAWLALVVTDVIAVASLARCFTGPGELTAGLVTLVLAHLVGLAARGATPLARAGARMQSWGHQGAKSRTAEERRHPSDRNGRARTSAWWALGLVLAVLLPVGFVFGPAFFWAAPGGGIWHTMPHDLRAGWAVFSFRVAPVPELPGLVLATAWAAGAAGLLAELISSKTRIPAVFALAPALGLYLFASALGTDTWRGLGLALMAGSTCWYLVAAVKERERGQGALVASSDSGLSLGERDTSYHAGALMLRMAVLAALAAAVVGLNLPGARNAALVAWHGTERAGNGTGSSVQGGNLPQGVEISTLVQVAEEEIDNPSGSLFTVHSAVPTREVVAVLDDFNGNSWSATPGQATKPLRSFSPPLGADERRPPPATADGPGHEQLVQVFEVSGLSGDRILPSWGTPLAVAGAGRVETKGSGSSIVSVTPVQRGLVYAVDSVVADPSTAQLEADSPGSSSRDLRLPEPVPPRLVRLANSLVAGATTAYQKASELDVYLTSARFRYQLPLRRGESVVTPSPGYGGLMSFLFKSRTGYCQQFATAFAVLARIDHLPTRIAVGFLTGAQVGHDDWRVDGSDTHAWPQVQFENYGWIDFEPTPGASVGGSSAPSLSTTTTATTVPVRTPPSSGGAHNLGHGGGAGTAGSARRGRRPQSPLAPWLLVFPAGLVCWAAAVMSWRRSRLHRSRREPRTGILVAWGEVMRTLDLAGIRRRRAETCMELARRVASTEILPGEAELALSNLARVATSALYGDSDPGDLVVRQATKDARTVVRAARRRIARWQLIAAALDPRRLPYGQAVPRP